MLLRAALAARAAGWQVRCLVPHGPLASDLRAAGVDVAPLPELRLPEAGSRLRSLALLALATLRASLAIRRAVGGRDVVLANGLLVLPALVLVPRRVARVWWAHDVLVRGDRLRLARACGRRLDLVVGVSQAVLSPLSGVGRRAVVVRNGVDLPVPAGPSDRRAAPLVGCNAALTPWKGQDVLLEAVALLGREDVHLELLGAAQPKDGAYEVQLQERADAPDLTKRVSLLGHVDEPLEVMRRWHVGVSASVDPEASGLGVLEGMSLGVPQVATAHGGPLEVLDGAGLLVPPGDAAALADALRRLLDDPELWERCARNGVEVVRATLHRPVQERALLDALEAAAAARSGRRGGRRRGWPCPSP
jgi:glycosyltransferase involved in cell wall biosynthesis